MKTDEIRIQYLSFFEARGAKIVPSDSLVPSNDPTLLFTGAGMNQFKDYFLGIGKMDFRRAASCQKCLRTGDILNVGVTPSHHTFFEMLGNFSFGDYFKKEAITWAWEFMTTVMGIPESRLQVSVHEKDDEAFQIWEKEVGLPPSKITRLGDHDNFWPADAPTLGPNGPCGPCSEIFFDRGPRYGCGRPDCGVTCSCRRWVEVWNLVFTQYDRRAGGVLVPLPQRNIDTGMGLERMASCMQDVPTNMDIDIFRPIVAAIADRARKSYGKNREDDILIRRIADHARAVTFCIADGVLPANTHRGYVLKRLLRRAVLDGQTLGIREPFLYALAPVVADVMKGPYPEVAMRVFPIADTIRLEEEKFLATLEKGLSILDLAVAKAKKEGAHRFDGNAAFELYDTYGFPYELTEERVAKEGLTIDREGFEAAMALAKERSRAGAKMQGDIFAKGPLTEVKKRTGKTEFVGYDTLQTSARVLALVQGETLVEEAKAGDSVVVILDQTSFYGESGGQVGDTGSLIGSQNLVVNIEDTQKVDEIHLHVGRVESGRIAVGMEVHTEVDAARRLDIRRNHTATHLLHKALQEVLGPKAEQRGSYVAPDRLRFDFQQSRALTPEERKEVEECVNHWILESIPVTTAILSLEEAKKSGAKALFGEKYGEEVRVVRIGEISAELCGGTHIDHTGRIGSFRILSEESVAAGIRRIEAITGIAAYRYSRRQHEVLAELAWETKTSWEELPSRLRAILEENRTLRKELASMRAEALQSRLATLQPQRLGEISWVATHVGEVLGKDLATAAETVRRRLGEGAVVVLVGEENGKVGLVVTVGKDLVAKGIEAGAIVKRLAPIIGGGGGGRPEMAQAGGKDPGRIPDLLRSVPEILSSIVSC